jgi:hypothetical protein
MGAKLLIFYESNKFYIVNILQVKFFSELHLIYRKQLLSKKNNIGFILRFSRFVLSLLLIGVINEFFIPY